MVDPKFVLGVDLDGVVADYYGFLRDIAAEWYGVPVNKLPKKVKWGLREWGIGSDEEYLDLHRFAVTQKDLFKNVKEVPGAGSALRRLDRRGDIRIRIITHRFFTKYTHQIVARQTTEWLDVHGIPYWDLCFMAEKDKVGASVYVEDGPKNIEALRMENKDVIIFSNSTNLDLSGPRARDWKEVEKLVVKKMLPAWKAKKQGDARSNASKKAK